MAGGRPPEASLHEHLLTIVHKDAEHRAAAVRAFTDQVGRTVPPLSKMEEKLKNTKTRKMGRRRITLCRFVGFGAARCVFAVAFWLLDSGWSCFCSRAFTPAGARGSNWPPSGCMTAVA